MRVHRGGGFTKDYLYLNGVSHALNLYKKEDITPLYVGKTGFAYLPVIKELIERQWINPPKYYPEYLKQPKPSSSVMAFLVESIRC